MLLLAIVFLGLLVGLVIATFSTFVLKRNHKKAIRNTFIGLVLITITIKLLLDHWIRYYADSVHQMTQISERIKK